MKNIMLICNAGMSTGMLAKKIEKESDRLVNVSAYGQAEYEDYLVGVDLILVSPQIRFMIPEIRTKVNIPVEEIAPVKYGMMDAKGILKDINSILGE